MVYPELQQVVGVKSAFTISLMFICQNGKYTFVGRKIEIISDTLAVGKAPPTLPPIPFAPMGESSAIGVEAIIVAYFKDGP